MSAPQPPQSEAELLLLAGAPSKALDRGESQHVYIEEPAETALGEPFCKVKPAMKLLGVENPQFTMADHGPWAPPLRLRSMNHVALEAVDVDAILRFYVKVLGFRQVPRPDLGFPGHWIKGPGASSQLMVHIIQRDDSVPHRLGKNWKEQYADGVEPEAWMIRRSHHVAFEVEDFEEAEATLRRHGLEYSRHVLPEVDMQQLFFYDPEGNGIEIGRYDATRKFFHERGESPSP